ncbi:MAG: NPCBM/NEW2 domain-containing protein [bacterium]|nr:NPCBM/NEW2 domain-containing protein [bacterium]
MKLLTWCLGVSSLVWLAGCQALRTATGEREYVSFVNPVWLAMDDAPVVAATSRQLRVPYVNQSAARTPLSVSGLSFSEGLGFAGTNVLVFTLGGYGLRIEFLVGVDDSSPDSNGTAYVELQRDGLTVWSARLRRGLSPQYCNVEIPAVHHLLLRIAAPPGVHTDILLPRIIGLPGLRRSLRTGRHAFAETLAAPSSELRGAVYLPSGTVLFPYYDPRHHSCLGLSNEYLCVIVSLRGGAIVHCGPSREHNLLTAPAILELHPRERLLSPLDFLHRTLWKWRLDSNGTLRLLSPPDPVHGVRLLRTFALASGAPTFRTTVLMKNSLAYPISWSLGLRVHAAAPRRFLLPPNSHASGWVMIDDGQCALLIEPKEPRHGLYPYDGRRIRQQRSAVTLYSELTPLSPQQFSAWEQYWTVGKLLINRQETLRHLQDVRTAHWTTESSRSLPHAASR